MCQINPHPACIGHTHHPYRSLIYRRTYLYLPHTLDWVLPSFEMGVCKYTLKDQRSRDFFFFSFSRLPISIGTVQHNLVSFRVISFVLFAITKRSYSPARFPCVLLHSSKTCQFTVSIVSSSSSFFVSDQGQNQIVYSARWPQLAALILPPCRP